MFSALRFPALAAAIILQVGSALAWEHGATPLSATRGNQWGFRSVSDGSGGIIAVWEDQRNGKTFSDDVYAQRISADGQTLWGRDGVAVCTADHEQLHPRLVGDGAGGVIIIWLDRRSGNASSVWSVYAQRIDTDGHAAWTPGGVLVAETAENWYDSANLIEDGNGGAIVLWGDTRSGQRDIYAQKITSNGSAAWTAGGIPVLASLNQEVLEGVAADGAGGAFVVYYLSLTGSGKGVYVQRIGGTGERLWAGNGPFLTTSWFNFRALAAGTAGALVSWESGSGSDVKVYAQLVTPDGTPAWISTGVEVSPPLGAYTRYHAAAGDSGSFLFGWSTVSGNGDLYVQKVSPEGTRLWGDNGVAVSLDPDRQDEPWVTPDGAGGAFVAWNDYPATQGLAEIRVQLQRFASDGSRAWAPGGVTVSDTSDATNPAISLTGGGVIVAWDAWGGTESDIYARKTLSSGVIVGRPMRRFLSLGSQDGWVLESTETSSRGGTFNATSSTAPLGDEALDRQYRIVLSFSTKGLPSGSTIRSATLKLRHADPLQMRWLGNIAVGVRRPCFGTSPALAAGDFQAGASRTEVLYGIASQTPGWYSFRLSPVLFNAINRNGTTQFRLAFVIGDDDDHKADVCSFYTGNAPSTLRPVLEVEYSPAP